MPHISGLKTGGELPASFFMEKIKSRLWRLEKTFIK